MKGAGRKDEKEGKEERKIEKTGKTRKIKIRNLQIVKILETERKIDGEEKIQGKV